MDLTEVKQIYFIGIGGIGMSATAGLAKGSGYDVLGSDSKDLYDPAKKVLDSEDVVFYKGYSEQNIIDSKADLYIVSAGEDLSNPEVKYLETNNIPIHSFPELLAELSKEKLRIVVAGTHGKSTTTALLGHLLQKLDDSSFMAGGVLKDSGTNFHFGAGHYFVFEGDEYKSLYNDPTPKFHYYKPDILVLTNLEFDHPDLFLSLEQMKEEFKLLIENMPDDGLIFYNADDANLVQLVFGTNIASVGFSLKQESAFFVSSVLYSPKTSFDVTFTKPTGEKTVEKYSINLPGEINVYNALAAITTLRTLGFKAEMLSPLLDSFQGLKRRFEFITEKRGITVIDDYAHHPTAVRETLLAARTKYPESRIWAIFEPHTFSRTKATLAELAMSFESADKVLIAEIYPARENLATATINGTEVVKEIGKYHKDAQLVKNKTEAIDIVLKSAKQNDVIIIMAVGNFNTLAEDLINKL